MKVINKSFFNLALAALMLLAVSAGTPEPALTTTPAAVPVQPTIEVVFLEGEVLIDGKEPELGDLLATKFVVQTGKGARCDIVLNSGNALSIGQNALADFDFASQVAQVRVDRGGLSSVLKKLTKLGDSDSFTVHTANAVAGVRGTSFCVWVDDTSSYICACNGIVRIEDSAGHNHELLEASHHAARYFSHVDGKLVKETAGMRHHTDELLQSVASRIGNTIDWSSIN